MILAQMRREFAVRSLAWWIPISLFQGLWIWGMMYGNSTTLGSIPLKEAPEGIFTVVFLVWMSQSIYLMNAGAAGRCTSRLDLSLPLASRRLWLNHMVVVMAGALAILGLPVAVIAAGNYLCDCRPLLQPGVVSMALHMTASLLLALGVMQSIKPTLWALPLRFRFIAFQVTALIGYLVLVVGLCALPRGYALIPLALAFLLLVRVYRRIPPTFTLATGAVEKGKPLKMETGYPESPAASESFWLLHSTIWRSSFGNWALGYLPLFMFHGFVLGLQDPGEHSHGTRTVYVFLTWVILASWHVVTKDYSHVIDAWPISRNRVFAVYILPSLAAVMFGYGAGFALSILDPQQVNVRSGECCPHITVPREFWEMARQGEIPDFETPWGESITPRGRSLYKSGSLQVYNPYCLDEGSSTGIIALAISDAVEKVYGKKIPHEVIRERFLETGEDGRTLVKEGGFTLLRDYPGLRMKSKGPLFPVIMMIVGLSWLLFIALSYRLRRSDVNPGMETTLIICLFGLFIIPGLGGLLLDGIEVVDLSSISIAFGIQIRQFAEWVPLGTLLAWLVSALTLTGGYLFAQSQFHRMESRIRPRPPKRT